MADRLAVSDVLKVVPMEVVRQGRIVAMNIEIVIQQDREILSIITEKNARGWTVYVGIAGEETPLQLDFEGSPFSYFRHGEGMECRNHNGYATLTLPTRDVEPFQVNNDFLRCTEIRDVDGSWKVWQYRGRR